MIVLLPEDRIFNARILYKFLLMTIVLVLSLIFFTLSSKAEKVRLGDNGQLSGKQGQVLWVEIPVGKKPTHVMGRFFNREMRFFPTSNGSYAGLLGIDMQDKAGLQKLNVSVVDPEGTKTLTYGVRIVEENYSVQRLTLPSKKVDLDQATLARVLAEKKELQEAFQLTDQQPLWEGSFIPPLKGRVTGVFGSRRIINGQPRSPHSGEDIAAPKGTEVIAMNTGMVRLTIDHFFTGKGVILDHGVGLHSMYFHLSSISVKEGQHVRKGQPIGKVGATGRATGPHLHWGVRLNGSRINPYSLTELPIQDGN